MENKTKESKSSRELALEWWNKLSDELTINKETKAKYADIYFETRIYWSLTDREIEEIWIKEVFEKNYNLEGNKTFESLSNENMKMLTEEAKEEMFEDDFELVSVGEETIKLPIRKEIQFIGNTSIGKMVDDTIHPEKYNTKQFKEFNPELFKAYIDKFSVDHKFNMFLILLKEFKLESSIDSNIMMLVALRNIK